MSVVYICMEHWQCARDQTDSAYTRGNTVTKIVFKLPNLFIGKLYQLIYFYGSLFIFNVYVYVSTVTRLVNYLSVLLNGVLNKYIVLTALPDITT